MAYTKPQQWKKGKSERLRRERDQIKFIDLRFERWQVVGLRKARRRRHQASSNALYCNFLFQFLEIALRTHVYSWYW